MRLVLRGCIRRRAFGRGTIAVLELDTTEGEFSARQQSAALVFAPMQTRPFLGKPITVCTGKPFGWADLPEYLTFVEQAIAWPDRDLVVQRFENFVRRLAAFAGGISEGVWR